MIVKVQVVFLIICTLVGFLPAQGAEKDSIVGAEQSPIDSATVSPAGKDLVNYQINNPCYGCKTVTTFGAGIAEALLAAAIASAYGKKNNFQGDAPLVAALSAGYILGCSLGTVAYGFSRNEKGSVAGSVAGSFAGAFLGGLFIGAALLTESDILEAMGVITCFITIPIGSVKGYEYGKK